jgi:glycosyl transferase family 1
MRITFLGNFGVDYSSETHHKKSLEALGHTVVPLQETQAGSELILNEAMKSDMFVWVHTHGWETPGALSMEDVLSYLKRAKIPSVTYHLDLWLGLQRQQDLKKDAVYKNIEHFFTVDKKMADWFNENTEVKGHYLPAGVFKEECYMAMPVTPRPPLTKPMNDVIFVGSYGYHPEWKYRPQLIDWLRATYRSRFKHYGGDGLGVVRGDKLNQLYADTKVAVGDSLCIDFDYPYYWSDRLYESTGRGAFTIFPYIEGIETQFELGKELVTYKFGDFDDLKSKIDYYLEHADEREKIRKAGFNRTKRDHTYENRWADIIREVTEVKR